MQITPLDRLSLESWGPRRDEDAFDSASETVESGHILHLPRLAFALLPHETRFLSERWSDGRSKNITLRSGEATLRGASGSEDDLAALRAMLERFAVHSQALIAALFPRYAKQAAPAHVTFRPCAIAGRASSVRKDDSRLHVDAFPANPTGGARILRVFTNLNPDAVPRTWRVGEPFADLAKKFLPRARRAWPGEAALLRALRVTRRRRSGYDHLMLELHDSTKADDLYQQSAPQERVDFPAGSTWILFSDQVSHAAMSGQHMMEQTLMLPVAAMRDPETSPLRVLERMTGHPLA
jgi:hypothetical protein